MTPAQKAKLPNLYPTMPAPTPSTRPRATRDQWLRAARPIWKRERPGKEFPAAVIVASPGYYRDSMGKPGVNDRGINDDAFAIIAPDLFVTFNGNTDPSIYRPEVATLKPGQVIDYRIGQHAIGKKTQHEALRQASPVIVRRDNLIKPSGYVHRTRGISLGDGFWTDAGYPQSFWINLHRQTGGTSSLGCLTIPAAQWIAFLTTAKEAMRRAGLRLISVILLEGPVS
ncbi:MAG: hypothetical protein RLZ97_1825 [Verrucomicrobiota bacterium]|jgi:lysozyme